MRRARSSSFAAPTIRRRAAATRRRTGARSRRRCTGSRRPMPFRPRSGSSISSSEAPAPDVANFAADLNPDSLEVLTGAMLEPAAAASNSDEPMQFERQGYFRRDRDSAPGQAGLRPHRRPPRHVCQDARAGQAAYDQRRRPSASANLIPGLRAPGARRGAAGAPHEPRSGCGRRFRAPGAAVAAAARAGAAGSRRCARECARSASLPSAPASTGSRSPSASAASSISLCRASRCSCALVGAALRRRGRRRRLPIGAARRGGSLTVARGLPRRRDGGEAAGRSARRRRRSSGRSSPSSAAAWSSRESRAERRPRIVLDQLRSDDAPAEDACRERIRVTLARKLRPAAARQRASRSARG